MQYRVTSKSTYILYNYLPAHSTDFLENMTVHLRVKKFPEFYRTRISLPFHLRRPLVPVLNPIRQVQPFYPITFNYYDLKLCKYGVFNYNCH